MIRLVTIICGLIFYALSSGAQTAGQLEAAEKNAKKIAREEGPQKALNYLLQNVKSTRPRTAEDWQELIRCYKQLGALATATGKDALALDYYAKGISLYQKSELPAFDDAAFTHGEIGLIYYRQGEYVRAREYFEEDQRLLEECCPDDERGFGVALYNLGNIEWMLGNYAQASLHYKKSLPLMKKTFGEDHFIVGTIYNNLGGVAWDRKDEAEALKYFTLAAEHELKRKGETKDPGSEWAAKGDSLMKTNLYGQAMKYYRTAYQARQRDLGVQNPYTVGCLTYMAAAANLTGDLQQSLNLYDSAIVGFTSGDGQGDSVGSWGKVASAPLLLEAMTGKLQVLLKLEDQDSSMEYLQQSFQVAIKTAEIIEHLRNTAVADGSKLHWAQKVLPFYENAIDACYRLWIQTHKPQYFDAALHFSEAAKAFLLSQALNGLAARRVSGLPDSVLQREHYLATEIARLERLTQNEQNKCDKASSKRLTAWQQQKLLLKQEQVQLEKEIERAYPKYHALKYQGRIPTFTELKNSELIDKSSGLVEYFVGNKWLFIFYLDDHYLILNRQPMESALAGTNSRFIEALNNYDFLISQPGKAFNQFTTAGFELYGKLLAPILQHKPNVTKLRIVPDGWLYYLPFEVLLTAEAKPNDNYTTLPYLLRQYQVSYIPSATVALQQFQNVSKEKAYAYSGFAPSYEGSESLGTSRQQLAPLRFNVMEVQEAAGLFEGLALTGISATKEAFFGQARESGILHLATHTVVDDQEPLLSSFAFAGDGNEHSRLYVYELYNVPMKAQLAILSGCNTGTGRLQRGEGVISLARGFSYAGCPSVLMSLWKVDDEATARITTGFLQFLKEDYPKDEALRKAKLDYLQSADPALAHPYYWAGMVLIGNSGPLESPSVWKLVMMLLAATVGVGAVWWIVVKLRAHVRK